MSLEEKSIERQRKREANFLPPYCPNNKCPHHLNPQSGFFFKYGVATIKRFPYVSQRFRCKHCSRTFSASLFTLNFWQKVWGGNELIFKLHGLGVSKRAIARELHLHEKSVRGRQIKMSRWTILKHALRTQDLRVEEPLVYDGLENFSFSQYDPNNLNHVVGKKTLFTYDFNLCPINRKGRMSERQVLRKRELETQFGAYPRNAIRMSTRKIMQRMLEKSGGRFVLYSDRHFEYRRALEELPKARIEHISVSSKVVRNYQNPLFAVNNIDLQARHNLAAFKRETIAFSKHSIAMLESFVLYMAHRNYMRPKFWGTHRTDKLSSKRCPAMELKLTEKIESFEEFFDERIPFKKVRLNEDWLDLYHRRDPLSRRPIKEIA